MVPTAIPLAVDSAERERLRFRPCARPVMRQTWRHLLFLHFPVDPDEIVPFLAPGLEPDLFPDESGTLRAWVGVVVFGIERIRLSGLPPFPGLAGFAEANVRTYVHRKGSDPSVLFLSLDGGPWITRQLARAWYGVPYIGAATALRPEEDGFHFCSRRPGGAMSDFRYRVDSEMPLPTPDSLEFFLLERYQLMAPTPKGIKRARVWHPPYRPYAVSFQGSTDLTDAQGIDARPFVHAVYCDAVEAEFFAPERLS